MKYLYYPLEFQEAGKVAEILLQGTECNVLLLNHVNFHQYQNGRAYEYFGGHFKQSPVHIQIPSSDVWFVVIDLGGYSGKVNANVRVIG